MKTVFLRVLEELHDKEFALRAAIRNPDAARGRQRFIVKTATFASVPRSPFAYWVSDALRFLFKNLPSLEGNGRSVCSGPDTGQDFRCIRTWWECDGRTPERWKLHAKGGVFSPYYSDVSLLILWGHGGEDLRSIPSANIRNAGQYFRAGLTWPLRTKSALSVRAMPADCIFGHKGPAILVKDDNAEELLSLLALCNSKAFLSLVEFQLAAADAKAGGAAHSYEVGVIQRTPIPHLGPRDRTNTAHLAHRAWSLKHGLDTRTETSHAFVMPALLQVLGDTLGQRANAWAERVRNIEVQLTAIQAEIDDRCFEFFGIDEADRLPITAGGGGVAADSSDAVDTDADADRDIDDEGDAESCSDGAVLTAELISWAVGVAFGRFDVRLATGARPLPARPAPFAPLPVCSPGMLVDDEGLQLNVTPSGYPIGSPENGMLVDDPGHARDLTAAVRQVFEEISKTSADAWWDEVGALLDPKGHDLRAWLSASFFEHHLKRFSKSRRKAPILWQLSTPSGRYSIWLYAHRLTRDSFFQIQNDVMTPKLAHEERQLISLMETAGSTPNANDRKEIATQEAFVEELRALLEEVKRVAPLWNPQLDDGVVLTVAPLWRLVPQHKPWQKELKSKWGELVVGKHDWAQLAMHLWPERVVPKCRTDRSLAIAHGLENVFWLEGDDSKWKPRIVPALAVDELVRERTSVAVKAALKSLLEAPAAGAIGSGSRRRRAANAAAAVGAR